jgi:dTDP-4-amino-4,6-dideoxygalactose transaminase
MGAIASLRLPLPVDRSPLSMHPFFQRELKVRPENTPNACRWWARAIPLPMWPDMNEGDVEAVAGIVQGSLGG